MKKIKLSTKKLQLNKEIISSLGTSNTGLLEFNEMDKIKGGTGGFSFLCTTSIISRTMGTSGFCKPTATVSSTYA